MEKVWQIRGRGKVMDSLKCLQKDFKFYSEFDQEPMEFLKDRREGSYHRPCGK